MNPVNAPYCRAYDCIGKCAGFYTHATCPFNNPSPSGNGIERYELLRDVMIRLKSLERAVGTNTVVGGPK